MSYCELYQRDVLSLTVISYLNDLLVGHTREEDVLFVLIRVESDHIWNLAVAEPLQALAGFRIPQLDITVHTTAQQPTAIGPTKS